MQVARHPLHRTPFAFSNEFMTGQTIANPINDLQRVGGFSRYQAALVALSAFVQFTIILDFTIMSPLGAIIMPTLGVDTLSVRPFEYVPSLDTTLVEARCVAWRVPRNFLEVATFSNRSEIPGGSLRSAVLRIVTTLSTLKGASPETLRCFKALRAEVCPDTIVILVIRPNVSSDVWNRPALIEAASDPRDDFSGLTRVKAQVSLGPQEVYVFYGGSFENSTVIACRPVEGKDCCRTATFASRSVVSLCRIASLEANCRTGGVFTRVCSR
jgi:hypothetical protein